MSKIQLIDLSKQYDKQGTKIIDGFNLAIKEREFIVIVGPSGCGKSTLLRMIAGLEPITGGELWMNQRLVNAVPPKDRDIAMVFQNYALYPHLSIFDNIAFSLKIRKRPKKEIKKQVVKTAEILGLTPYLKRKPKDLSGGQKQRVALGRAIVRDANIFLMDEPLSNLDAKLRVQMREEIIGLHRRLQATTIYVTHDQTEAMTMATRIVVLKDGTIQQIGTPQEVYQQPENMFVAGFLGAPPMNFIKGYIKEHRLHLPSGEVIQQTANPVVEDGDVVIGIRPEHMQLGNRGIKITVDYKEMMGADLYIHGHIQDSKIIIRASPDQSIHEGDVVFIHFQEQKIHLFDPKTEEAIAGNRRMMS